MPCPLQSGIFVEERLQQSVLRQVYFLSVSLPFECSRGKCLLKTVYIPLASCPTAKYLFTEDFDRIWTMDRTIGLRIASEAAIAS